jgi:hypothetical protein
MQKDRQLRELKPTRNGEDAVVGVHWIPHLAGLSAQEEGSTSEECRRATYKLTPATPRP